MGINTGIQSVEPVALYVHWPWCLSKCPYCDFNSHALVPGAKDQKAYRSALLAELKHFAQITPGRPVGSIFFGGGTPSLMNAATVHDIIKVADHLWGLDEGCEITLEANPTSIETAKFRAFRDAGINRVSVGIQALNDDALQFLGREHTADEARHALDIAGAIFERFTFDMIYARPGQGLGEWHDELEQALDLTNGHISLYQLTIEPGTKFFKTGVNAAIPDVGADFYQLTHDITHASGLFAYEISNHARPGQESRHNMTYWQGGDYIGVGPGAHGRLSEGESAVAHHQIADPERWLARVKAKGHGTAKSRVLTTENRTDELILMGLRLRQGLDLARFRHLTGCDILDVVDGDAMTVLQTEGLVDINDTTLAVTDQGRLVLSAIIEKLLV